MPSKLSEQGNAFTYNIKHVPSCLSGNDGNVASKICAAAPHSQAITCYGDISELSLLGLHLTAATTGGTVTTALAPGSSPATPSWWHHRHNRSAQQVTLPLLYGAAQLMLDNGKTVPVLAIVIQVQTSLH